MQRKVAAVRAGQKPSAGQQIKRQNEKAQRKICNSFRIVKSMSQLETILDNVENNSELLIHLTNGNGFAWNEIIEGTVLIPQPTQTVTYSLISVSIVEQDIDGFMSPVGFAGRRDPLFTDTGLGDASSLGTVLPIEIQFGETVIARDITLTNGSPVLEIAFSLPVPSGIPLTEACFVTAQAVASFGRDNDLHTAVPFILLPPRSLQAVQNSLKTFGDFVAVEISDAPNPDGKGYQFTLDYVAPESLQDRLDGIKFILSDIGDTVTGIAEINPQEHSLADHLRAFLHADRIRVPLQFNRAELDTAGKANLPSESVQQRLHELLDPFLHPVAS